MKDSFKIIFQLGQIAWTYRSKKVARKILNSKNKVINTIESAKAIKQGEKVKEVSLV